MSNVRMAFDGGRTRSPIADALATGPRVLKIWLNNRLLNKGYCPILVRAYHFLCTTYKVYTPCSSWPLKSDNKDPAAFER